MAVKTNYEKNGNNYYRVTATVGKKADGKPIRKEFYGKSKKEAEAKKEEYLNNLKLGLSLDFDKITVETLFYTWLFEIIKVSNKIKPSTFERYESVYRNYIKNSEISNILICEIKSMQIQKFYNNLYKNGKTSASIEILNRLLKTFFNYAVDENYLIKSPISKKITIPGDATKNKKRVIEVFTNDELKTLKNGIRGHQWEMLILLALGTGLRQGELLGLRWCDISFKGQELTVNQALKTITEISNDGTRKVKTIIQIPKTKNSLRTVPIPSSLIEKLKEHKAKEENKFKENGISFNDTVFVFTNKFCTYADARALLRSFKRILNRLNLPEKKIHTLRHTFATKLFEADVPLLTVSKLLGHSDIETTEIYTHVMPQQKTRAVDKLNNLFT